MEISIHKNVNKQKKNIILEGQIIAILTYVSLEIKFHYVQTVYTRVNKLSGYYHCHRLVSRKKKLN